MKLRPVGPASIALVLTMLLVFAPIVGGSTPAAAGFAAEGFFGATAMDYGDADHGWIVGESGFVSATTDGGETWYRQYAPTSENLTCVFALDANHCWVAGDHGTVLSTSDGGIHWTVLRTRPALSEYVQAISFADANNGWAVGQGMYDSPPFGIVWRTTDGGRTWSRQNPFPDDPYPGRAYTGVSCVSPAVAWVCTESKVMGDGYGDLHIFRTVDGGATWAEVSRGPHMSGGSDDLWAFSDIQFIDTKTGWVVGTFGRVMRTDSAGDAWSLQTSPGVAPNADAVDMWDANHGVVSDINGMRIATTDDGGNSWNSHFVGETGAPDELWQGECLDVARPASSEVAGILDASEGWGPDFLARSTDSGATWTRRAIDEGNTRFIGGLTRYETAVEISKAAFSAANTVLLVTGRDYPDALAAGSLAGAYDAPILLCGETLSTVVLSEMRRLEANDVVIVGGTGAVSSAIESQLAAEFEVERIGGADRYDTARLVAERMRALGADTGEVFIARGDGFADALSAAPYAAGQRMPVLLVRTDGIPQATAEALKSLEPSASLVVGGTGAVGQPVVDALRVDDLGGSQVERVAAGLDRYGTSAQLARYATGRGWAKWTTPGLATGANFPDALAGGAALGHTGQALLLVRPDSLPKDAGDVVMEHDATIEGVWIFGNRIGAVGDTVANATGRIIAR